MTAPAASPSVPPLIALFTDFGVGSPYVGQMTAAIARAAPQARVIDLLHDAAPFDPRSAAYLLAAYAAAIPAPSTFVCVVDPGVGGDRRPIVVSADGRTFVGPDNGLLEIVRRRGTTVETSEIDWRPDRLSPSFHGRDLFAPVAARLAIGTAVERTALPEGTLAGADWPDDLAQVIYVDRYGNAVTGIRSAAIDSGATVIAGGRELGFARTFSDAPAGRAFWYANANGLVELAVSLGRADTELAVGIGAPVEIRT